MGISYAQSSVMMSSAESQKPGHCDDLPAGLREKQPRNKLLLLRHTSYFIISNARANEIAVIFISAKYYF